MWQVAYNQFMSVDFLDKEILKWPQLTIFLN